jgi:hypothetical protein
MLFGAPKIGLKSPDLTDPIQLQKNQVRSPDSLIIFRNRSFLLSQKYMIIS